MPWIRSLLLPALAVALLAFGDRYGSSAWISRETAVILVRGALALVFLLGIRFRRGRSAFTAVVFAAFVELSWLGGASAAAFAGTLAAARILLPMNLAALAGFGEFAPFSRRGGLRLGILGLQAALISPWGLRFLAAAGAPELVVANSRLEAISFGLSALVLLALVLHRPNPLEGGWLAHLAAFWLALHGAEEPVLLFLAGAVVLGLALIQDTFALAFEDGLTGLPGRRALDERLQELTGPYALAMVDLDHFKQLNDRHGHQVGDEVLRLVASRLRSIPGGGSAYRYGGEEFTILFPGKSAKEAKPFLESLRLQIARHPFTVRSSQRGSTTKQKKGPGKIRRTAGGAAKNLSITTSIGLAERGPKRRPPQDVLKAADTALYRAKRGGRNRLAQTTR